MDKHTRNQIEQHFYAYATALRKLTEHEAEIIEAGLAVNPESIRVGGGRSDPTSVKAMKLLDIKGQRPEPLTGWNGVIQSVFESYRLFRPDVYTIMEAKYIMRLSSSALKRYVHRNTICNWRQEWIEKAYNLAIEREVLE